MPKIRIEDCQFGIQDGVTVLTGPGGRLIVLSLRSYDEPLDIRMCAPCLSRVCKSLRQRQCFERRHGFERVVDAGQVIGVTREGVATSFYKVITDGANTLVTAFPVKP